MRKFISIISIILFFGNIWGYDIIDKGIYYNVDLDDMTLQVTESGDYKNSYNGKIIIPSHVVYNGHEFTVTSIGECAFYPSIFDRTRTITSVQLPNTLKVIGVKAFLACRKLSSITIPSSVEKIRAYAFARCESLKSITIPSSVHLIGDCAFLGAGITDVKIEDSKKPLTVRAQIFESCHHIRSIYIGRNILFSDFETDTDIYLLDDSDNLTNVTLGKDVTKAEYLIGEKHKTLRLVNSYSPNPPKIGKFTNGQYLDLEVNIPKGSLEAYKSDPGWSKFFNLKETL